MAKLRRTKSADSFIRAAERLDLLTPTEALQAEKLIQVADENEPTADILVRAQLLNPEEAHTVEEARKHDDVLGHVTDCFKIARRALKAQAGATRQFVLTATTKDSHHG